MPMLRRFLAVAMSLALAGCATASNLRVQPAAYPARTATLSALEDLPPPNQPLAVAVYGFTDQTGQYEPSSVGQTLSRAVSQGGGSVLVQALRDTSHGRWFTVVERERLDNLLRERQIINEMRARYLGEREVNPQALPALLFAGVLLEGGIIGYDTNTRTGGAGAALLGIGASVQYRQDTVTVYLRAVSVRTGEVLASVNASKTILSRQVGASAYRFVAYRELLETEVGFTTNEPDQVALEQAIQKALYALILEGAQQRLWQFSDETAAATLIERYNQERNGALNARQVEALQREERRGAGTSTPRGQASNGQPRRSNSNNRADATSAPQAAGAGRQQNIASAPAGAGGRIQ